MKNSVIAVTAVLSLLVPCLAGASVLEIPGAISLIRERSLEFGYDISAYSNEEMIDFLRTIPAQELKEFRESYARRPDIGTVMTAKLEVLNRVEFEREKKLLGKWIGAWRKRRVEYRLASGSHLRARNPFAAKD